MDELTALLVLLGILLFSAGPVAVMMAIVLFKRLRCLEDRLRQLQTDGDQAPVKPAPTFTVPLAAEAVTKPAAKPAEPARDKATPVCVDSAVPTGSPLPVQKPMQSFQRPIPPLGAKNKVGLEQKIGITAALIVGVITVIIGVGFFLKYMYEHMTFPPAMRVCMVALGGAAALIVGEIIRRRNYGIVARGLSALGFALFYAAVFSAARVYDLIGLQLALVLALSITVASMAYAVGLNERLIAFLSLLGGYLSPLVIMYERDLPVPIFSYVLALSLGAIICAACRRWRIINWVTWVGTWLLYTVWFEEYYMPSHMTGPLVWLGIFGGGYVLLPILSVLIRRVQSRSEDTMLVVVNSLVVFYYLCRILTDPYQKPLAFCVAALAVLHGLLMAVVKLRCGQDKKLLTSLGVLATAFLTTAIGLYFTEMSSMILSWSVEAVVLTFVGIRYKSLWPKAMSMIVAAVASAGLFYHLPLHENESFRLIFNAPFGTWLFVCGAIGICGAMWRGMVSSKDSEQRFASQVFYIWMVLLLIAGCCLEWFAWCRQVEMPVKQQDAWILPGFLLIAALAMIMIWQRPIAPDGRAIRLLGIGLAVAGSIYAVLIMPCVYNDGFILFVNRPFGIAVFYVVTVLGAAWRARTKLPGAEAVLAPSGPLVLLAMGLFWLLLSEQIYSFYEARNLYVAPIENWHFIAQMMVSLSWAIYAVILLLIGFFYRAAGVRYLSLTIFTVLLAKINWDIQELPTEYRITTFVTTGLILVGVSFLYQFLRKKGFFETGVVSKTESQKNPVNPVNPV